MITLGPIPCDEFRVDAGCYSNAPSGREQDQIRWIEKQIITQSNDFLQNPEWFIDQWEELTGETMPQRYTSEIPMQIRQLVFGGKGEGIRGYDFGFLPVLDSKGKKVSYPQERLVSDYKRRGQCVYILKDSILKSISKR